MDKKKLGVLVAAAGVALAVISALADPIGLGAAEKGFGWKQIAGVVVGVAIAAFGARLAIFGRRLENQRSSP